MNAIAKPLALLALAATFVAPLLTALGTLGDGPMKTILLVSAIVWFVTAPRWLTGGKE